MFKDWLAQVRDTGVGHTQGGHNLLLRTTSMWNLHIQGPYEASLRNHIWLDVQRCQSIHLCLTMPTTEDKTVAPNWPMAFQELQAIPVSPNLAKKKGGGGCSLIIKVKVTFLH